jgi:hypothetical protein
MASGSTMSPIQMFTEFPIPGASGGESGGETWL